MSFAEQFGRNLAAARQRQRPYLSQEDLGLRAGLHRTAVGQLERGQRVSKLDTYVKLIDSLGLERGDLLEGLCWQPADFTEGQWSASDDATL